MADILIATRNPHKTAEIAAMLGDGHRVRDLTALPDAPDIEETGRTFSENAAIKADAISALTKGWVLADDSGLEVDALEGAPGVLSARFAGEPSNDAANNALLLVRLSELSEALRTARFRCVLALSHAGTTQVLFEGDVEGRIADAPRGSGGFGYDPLFVPDGHEETFGELPPSAKNAISHRSRALEKLRTWLAEHPGSLKD